MSHWMTSGSARLKAKQPSSFSRRARYQAALVGPNDTFKKTTVLNKRIRKHNKSDTLVESRRYSYGNPITRRGVAVSVENIMHSTIPVHVMKAEKIQSLNRLAKHSGLRQSRCAGIRNISARKTLRKKIDYRQCPALNLSHLHFTRNRLNRCINEQSLRSLYKHTNNDAFIKMAQNGRHKLLKERTASKKNIFTTSSNKSLSSIYNINKDVHSISQTPGKWHQQKTTGIGIEQKRLHTELSPDNGPIEIGIHRFQKREEYPSELIHIKGGSGMDSFGNRNSHIWGDMNDKDSSLDTIPRF